MSDSGCGIHPDKLEKIFEPFHTSKPDGMGLGLSICRTIVENHGGRITAESGSDCGTQLLFTLPLAENSAKVQSQGASFRDQR